jgi:hypothetical protein
MATTEKSLKLDSDSGVKTTEIFDATSGKKPYYESGDEESFSTDSYDENLEWTDEEEQKVRNKLDLRLMSFVLLMTFVLNMDRTNICKVYKT